MGMGNAFTAIADDADAVFYNPAGIAFNSGIQLRMLNPKFEASDDLRLSYNYIRKITEDGFSQDALDKLFGKNIHLNGSIFPSLLLPHFTVGYYADFNGDLSINNTALPQISVNYYYTRGFVAGFGSESRGIAPKHLFRYGVTGKVLTRTGINQKIPVTTFVLNDSGFVKSLISDPGTGFGIDLGFQYEIPFTQNIDFITGFAWHDIGDTSFGTRLQSRIPPPIKSNMALGGAVIFGLPKKPGYNFKVSGEVRHMEDTGEDPRKKLHFGTELCLRELSVQAGLSQLSWTLGAKVDLWLFEVAASSYASQALPLWGMKTERRYMVQFTMKIDASSGRRSKDEDFEKRKRPRLYQ